jgi:glycosyltransferase involved in cell wall biosynthesis
VGTDGEALRGAGIVIDPGHLDPELGLAVRLLIETPEISSQLGRLARERVVERFSLSTNIDRLMDLYRRLLTARVVRS